MYTSTLTTSIEEALTKELEKFEAILFISIFYYQCQRPDYTRPVQRLAFQCTGAATVPWHASRCMPVAA